MLWTQSKKFREWLNHESEIDMVILTESSHKNLENILTLFYSGKLLLKANEVYILTPQYTSHKQSYLVLDWRFFQHIELLGN